jgi:23S rRNA (cytidine1920-2'-O)/16S rRNA (cytidine1409-2'-O)-methyltransferase
MPRIRLDLLLVGKELAASRAKAQALIMAGQVRVDGEVELKPSALTDPAARVEVEQGPRYVSRGGEKLAGALEAFAIDVRGLTCADVGASTGGFTDCLLQHGATRVYAIDVGKGILHWKLRTDPRVVVLEGTNARFLESLPEPVSFVTIDASFISLKTLLPAVKRWLMPVDTSLKEDSGGIGIVALIKPQFEAGRREVGRGAGVIRDATIHRRVLAEVLEFAQLQDLRARGLIRSPLLGPKGNAEFLAWLDLGGPAADIQGLIDATLSASAKVSE